MNTHTSGLFVNAMLLEERMGGWPSFHDAEVLRVHLSRNPEVVLSMDLYVFVYSEEVDASGRFKHKDPSIVTFSFYGVRELLLQDFNEQNALQEMACSRGPEGDLLVEILGVYGLSGAFVCDRAEVAAVRPAD